mmetsp:Transcript_35435/g.86083  ORF Transcript_35435/g.86083 Transcript_35435/m.86083 type:complete len:257 (+) Transcript_35435:259-1029(+)
MSRTRPSTPSSSAISSRWTQRTGFSSATPCRGWPAYCSIPPSASPPHPSRRNRTRPSTSGKLGTTHLITRGVKTSTRVGQVSCRTARPRRARSRATTTRASATRQKRRRSSLPRPPTRRRPPPCLKASWRKPWGSCAACSGRRRRRRTPPTRRASACGAPGRAARCNRGSWRSWRPRRRHCRRRRRRCRRPSPGGARRSAQTKPSSPITSRRWPPSGRGRSASYVMPSRGWALREPAWCSSRARRVLIGVRRTRTQ